MTLVNPENPTSYQPLTRDRVHMLSYQGNHYLRIDAVPVGSNVSSEGEANVVCTEGIGASSNPASFAGGRALGKMAHELITIVTHV